MFFDIWKEEIIEKAKKEAKALRKKNKKREKQSIRKEIQAGDLGKIETRNVRFFNHKRFKKIARIQSLHLQQKFKLLAVKFT